MAGKTRVQINSAGAAKILTSSKMRELLKARGDVVKSRDSKFVGYEGTSPGGGRVSARARYRVGYPASLGVAGALGKEARTGKLMRALGGG